VKLYETDLRLVERGKYLVPDRNYDYFLLKRLMFSADLNMFHGVRLLTESDQFDRVLKCAGDVGKAIQITYAEEWT
jgi:hypothetical protein